MAIRQHIKLCVDGCPSGDPCLSQVLPLMGCAFHGACTPITSLMGVACLSPPWRQPRGKSQVNLPQMLPPGGSFGALVVYSHCIASCSFEWELTEENLDLPPGCLQGGKDIVCL